jgi:hypothetical protein
LTPLARRGHRPFHRYLHSSHFELRRPFILHFSKEMIPVHAPPKPSSSPGRSGAVRTNSALLPPIIKDGKKRSCSTRLVSSPSPRVRAGRKRGSISVARRESCVLGWTASPISEDAGLWPRCRRRTGLYRPRCIKADERMMIAKVEALFRKPVA